MGGKPTFAEANESANPHQLLPSAPRFAQGDFRIAVYALIDSGVSQQLGQDTDGV